MPNLFDKTTGDEILYRIENLQVNNQRKWGRMNAAQMLAHLHYVLQLATGDKVEKPTFMMKLMGPIIKKVVLSEKPYKQGLPTGPNFIIADERIFETEKAQLIATYKKFITEGAAGADGRKHPIFGKLTADEWGYSQWKHFDHHLRQFSA